MAHLKELYLSDNQIGDPGLSALSGALASGAMANLEMLVLWGNQIGDVGMSAFAQAIKPISEGGSGALASSGVLG